MAGLLIWDYVPDPRLVPANISVRIVERDAQFARQFRALIPWNIIVIFAAKDH